MGTFPKSSQCRAIIKKKSSKLFNCRCPYKSKYGNYCGRHKKIGTEIISKSIKKKKNVVVLRGDRDVFKTEDQIVTV